jgi:hypothetical protein
MAHRKLTVERDNHTEEKLKSNEERSGERNIKGKQRKQ